MHEGPNGPDGYAAYRVKHDWSEEQSGGVLDVVELIAERPGANAELWRFCFDVDLIRKVVGWCRPVEEPLLYLLAEPRRLNLTVGDGLWVRLVDLPGALEARRYATEGRLAFEVTDPFCPWNAGRWALEAGPDGAACRRTEEEPAIRLDAADLGALYLGGASLRTLAAAGRVAADEEGALARGDALFRWDPPPWCPFVF